MASSDAAQHWRGTIGYFQAERGDIGYEHFSITRHQGGTLTLRAICNMTEDGVERDTVLTLDSQDTPLEAYQKTLQDGVWLGSAHYHFAPDALSVHLARPGQPPQQVQRQLDRPATFFGSHSLINDAWLVRLMPEGQETCALEDMFVCSHAANGGGAPDVYESQATLARLNDEEVTVAAGTYACTHYQVTYIGHPPIDMWVTGKEFVLVLMTWAPLGTRYELVEFENK